MKKRFMVLFLLLILAVCPVFAAEEFNEADFSEFVNRQLKTWNVPGCAVLIVKDGKVVLSKGFGYRDVENKKKVTPKTMFAIGSASKAFTAASIGMLADEKKLDLDEPVRNFFPFLRMYDKYAAEHLTLRDALCHRSGLPRHELAWLYSGLTRHEAVEKIRYLKPNKGFRESMEYNNWMFVLSGVVVEKISGKSWEEFVRTRIYNPLGMTYSNFSIDKMKQTGDYALPYTLNRGKLKNRVVKPSEIPRERIPYYRFTAMGPAGSINSNIVDLKNWILFHINKGEFNDGRLLKKATIKEMHAPQVVIEKAFHKMLFPEMPVCDYGLGWFIQPYRGHYWVHHGGNIDGFSALVSFMPREKIGVVVLTNLNATPFTYTVSLNAYDRVLGFKPIDWSGRFIDKQLKGLNKMVKMEAEKKEIHKKGSGPSHPLKDYAGKFNHPAYGVVIVKKVKDGLKLKFKVWNGHMKHCCYDTFSVKSGNPLLSFDLHVAFKTGDKGGIDSLALPLEPSAGDIVFKRVDE